MPRSKTNSEIATANRTVSRTIAARDQLRHWEKLAEINERNIRPNNIDHKWRNNSQPVYRHLNHNMKKFRIQDQRFAEIERENYILLDKMCKLWIPKATDDPTEGTWQFSPGVRLNRFQVPVTDHGISLSPMRPQFGQAQIKESLNSTSRRRELERIMRENRGIVERIERQETHYPNGCWEARSREHDRHLQLCSRPVLGYGFGFSCHSKNAMSSASRIGSRPRKTNSPRTTSQNAMDDLLYGTSRSKGGKGGKKQPRMIFARVVGSSLIRSVESGAAELLVGISAGFCAGQEVVIRPGEEEEETVEIFECLLRRTGLALLLSRATTRAHPAGSLVTVPLVPPRDISTAPASVQNGLDRLSPHDATMDDEG
ncbi:hypothetical protein AB1Y20_002846 [Prymnesium parvum]|uniref:Uncharacterized protein n=1 Tax=Prymnesium parvum TaxID=97485 RepID=A0AB34JCS6_PRYPA